MRTMTQDDTVALAAALAADRDRAFPDLVRALQDGIYSGALGYFDVRGGVDTSVVIRTFLIREGRAHLHVGGGIVADSTVEGEYRESLDKASALFDALAWSDSGC